MVHILLDMYKNVKLLCNEAGLQCRILRLSSRKLSHMRDLDKFSLGSVKL